jgi:hypothetical protein
MTSFEEIPEVRQVIFLVFREYGDIIKVDHDRLVNKAMESNVHFSLESGTNVYQSKMNFPIGISAPWSMKSGFKLV